MTTRTATLSALRGRRDLGTRALILTLIFSLSTPADGVSLGTLKGYKGFQAAALAVAFVNKAMREASENPMDTWRRQNVAHAVGLLPIGIRALAQEFQSNKLHDGDLKFVTGILGGFVDMSAPDKFQKFMKDPSDKSLIPQLGANFPQEILRQADEQGFPMQSKSVVFDESAKGKGAASQMAVDPTRGLDSMPSVPVASQELANLYAVSNSGKSGEQRGNAVSKSVVFDEDAPKNPSGYNALAPSAKRDGLPNGSPSGFEIDLARDIASVESQLGLKPREALPSAQALTKVTVLQPNQAVTKSSLSEDFFAEKKMEKKVAKKPVSRRDPANYKTKIRPKYWKVVPLLMLFVKEAGAAAATGATGATGTAGTAGTAGSAPAANQSSCQGGGGCGGKGEGGEGKGGGAADFLFGLAAIVAAAAPMVAAGIQADADKKVAKINADAQITMSNIAADNAKYMADSQSRIAQQQNQIAQDINKKNNDEQTKRLAMQLNEVRSGREQAYQSEVDRRSEERKLNEERIALAQRQADDNLKLARASFNAQLTQAGLSTGFSNISRPGGNLSVENKIQPGRVTGATTPATGGTGSIGSSFGNSNFTGPSLASNTASSNGGKPSSGQAAMRAIASSKLLTSAKNSRGFFDEDSEEDPNNPDAKKKKYKRKGSISVRGVRRLYRGAFSVSSRMAAGSSYRGELAYSDLALGSTRGFKSVTAASTKPEETKTDLSMFANQATSSNRGFAAWRTNQVIPVSEEIQNATTRAGSPRTVEFPRGGAYNAPDLGTHGGGATGRGIY